MKTKYMLAISLAIAAAACSKEDVLIGETEITSINTNALPIAGIPFADEQTLTDIAATPQSISYSVARKLALVEMEVGMRETMDWHGAKLSEKPVVVFDGKSNAKYYEFIVTNEAGEGIGTVTTLAQKKTDRVAAFALPYVRDYASLTTKGNGYKQVDGGYPTRILLGIPGKAGEEVSAVIDPKNNEAAEPEPERDVESIIAQLNSLPPEALGDLDVSTTITEIQKRDNENTANAQEFWAMVDATTDDINATTDEQILAKLNESKGASYWYTYDYYYIPAFNTDAMKYTRWSGWCGPSAIAWIYRGLYSSYYKGTYLPLYSTSSFEKEGYRELFHNFGIKWAGFYEFSTDEDADGNGVRDDCDKDWVTSQSANADGGLYARIADLSGMYKWQWATPNEGNTLGFDGGYNAALRDVTNGYYGFSGINFFGSADYIRSAHLPVLISTGSHIMSAFASKIEWYNWDVYVRIFGCKINISNGKVTSCTWVLIHDNGNLTRKNIYGPYWYSQGFSEYDINFRVQKLK
jgi:hypothetical protein